MAANTQANSTLTVWRTLPTAGKIAALFALVTIAFAVVRLANLAGELWSVPRAGDGSAATDEQGAASYEASLDRYAAMSDGRTLFLKPARPRTTRAPVRPRVTSDEPEDSSVPSSYGGPNIIAMVGNEVWFDDDTRISAGEALGDLEVVSVRTPWSAHLRWRGGEFEATLFDRSESAIPLLPDESADEQASGDDADTTETEVPDDVREQGADEPTSVEE
ncbi:MAG: hypothetical protein KAS72_04585 [Phycisphaerales bacterium]|nr:hypothetical protein [Phycisphaerales bacterium]